MFNDLIIYGHQQPTQSSLTKSLRFDINPLNVITGTPNFRYFDVPLISCRVHRIYRDSNIGGGGECDTTNNNNNNTNNTNNNNNINSSNSSSNINNIISPPITGSPNHNNNRPLTPLSPGAIEDPTFLFESPKETFVITARLVIRTYNK